MTNDELDSVLEAERDLEDSTEGIEAMDVCSGGSEKDCCVDCSWHYQCKKTCENGGEDYLCEADGTEKCWKRILNMPTLRGY